MTNSEKKSDTLIEDILSSGDLTRFKGIKEDALFEAKASNSYNLAKKPDMYELLKDVSAFANADGGHLIIGLITKKLEKEQTDVVSKLDLFPKNSFDIRKCLGILRSNIYPVPEGIDVLWCPNRKTNQGLISIFVPAQSEEKKYFIVHSINEKEAGVKGGFIGLYTRSYSDNVPMSAKSIYGYLREGRSPIAQRLSGIEAKLEELISTHQKSKFKLSLSEVDSLTKRMDPKDLYWGSQ